jgi:hypothetical protein
MYDVSDSHPIDASVTPSPQAKPIKERRRTGRIDDISPALTSLLRNPAKVAIAGNTGPVDRFQIAAERAASSYTAIVWLTVLGPSERSAAIYRELRKLDEEFIEENGASQA